MCRLVGVIRLEAATGQVADGGVDGVLVGDDDQIAVTGLGGVRADAAGDACGETGEALGGEREIVGVLEVCLELARALDGELLPDNPGPSPRNQPLGESLVLGEPTPGGPVCDHPGRLHGAS